MNHPGLSELKGIFQQKFYSNPRIFVSPARINIIGEHVDYLGGLVLPAAIQFSTNLAIRENQIGKFRLFALHFGDIVEIPRDNIQKQDKSWVNYILGVLSELQKEGYSFGGFDLLVGGNIPQGAGLSSSASLEVGVGFAVSEIFGLGLSREKLAVLGQKAENNFVGTQCGIMDQFIISVGKKGHCILLDTETLEYSYETIQLDGFEFYLINSHVKHSLEASSYNDRRREAESAFQKLKPQFGEAKNLYSIPFEKINFLDFQFTTGEAKRLEHVFGEKKRTRDMIDSLSRGNLKKAGSLLTDTHHSLRDLYEVSCTEVDYLVELLEKSGVAGARMIGGGFGGCVLVLDEVGRRERITPDLLGKYKEKTGISAEVYSFELSEGVHEIKMDEEKT